MWDLHCKSCETPLYCKLKIYVTQSNNNVDPKDCRAHQGESTIARWHLLSPGPSVPEQQHNSANPSFLLILSLAPCRRITCILNVSQTKRDRCLFNLPLSSSNVHMGHALKKKNFCSVENNLADALTLCHMALFLILSFHLRVFKFWGNLVLS